MANLRLFSSTSNNNTVAKTKTIYVCSSCGHEHTQWAGQCSACKGWNLLSAFNPGNQTATTNRHYAGIQEMLPVQLSNVEITATTLTPTQLSEFDRVLGGGLVAGAVVLIGGDPGIGKSTLLLQVMAKISQRDKVLYVTGEESASQVALRAQRLGLIEHEITLLTATDLTQILTAAEQQKPSVMVIDSIQTAHTAQLTAAPGSVSQVRECAAQLVRYAKQTATSIFVIGHVTKEGALAGPRVLEHMVDTVLYFEGDSSSRFRLIRAIKNRFGAVNEIGVMAMTEQVLKPVNNPICHFFITP